MRKVFLDLGAHAAISVKKFREEYPNSDEYEIISFEFATEIKLNDTNNTKKIFLIGIIKMKFLN